MSRPPNFFVAGVPKAGTTSLYHYLGQHPGIYLSPIKEPTFFGADDILQLPLDPRTRAVLDENRQLTRDFIAGPMTERRDLGLVTQWETYLQLFRNVRGERAVGEGSVSYVWLPGAAAAIHERLPASRIILILRDPSERLFSHYLSLLWNQPRLSFRAAFLTGAERGGDWTWAIEVGRYHSHLRRFLGLFPRDRVRVHLYEDYRRDPSAVLRDLFGFLEVDPDVPVDLSRRLREPAVPRFRLLHAIGRRLGQVLPVPAGLRRQVQAWGRRPRDQVRMDPDDRRLVIEHYRDEIIGAGDLIGRDLTSWLS